MRALRIVAFAWLALVLPAHADVFHTTRELLASHFARSERVSYVRVRPEGDRRASMERALGRPLARREYVVFHATRGGRTDGFAIFDSERGQHEPIDIGTFFDPNGRITRVEILAYREHYGGEVRSPRFLRQLVGRDSQSGFTVGRDLDAISGATISARSVARAAHRAALLVALARP